MNKNLKNIVIINDFSYINGGAAKVAISSAVGLKKKGYNVIYYTSVGNIDTDLIDSGVKVITLNGEDILNGNFIESIFSGIWNKKAYKNLKDILAKLSPKDTIIHIHGWTKAMSSSVIKACIDSNFKFIFTAHDYFSICPNGGLYNYQKNNICNTRPLSLKCLFTNCDSRRYSHKLWRYCRGIVQNKYMKECKNMIALSNNNGEVIKRIIKDINVFYINNPIDLNKQDRVKVELNKKIAFIGRLSKEKGVDLLVEATKDYEYEVEIIGDGVLRENIKNINPKVNITGWLNSDELLEKLKSIRTLVLPSRWYEGMPNVVLEAMSMGIPVITSDICNAKEIIKEGKNGFIFKNNSVKSLSSELNKINDDNRIKDISKYAYNLYWSNSYSLEKHIKSLEAVYEEILE
ncbi:glycosyltransferase family 4 protein [Clostridium perfringens]|uniref:glycosyltransferase family 4 protein n=1 Tax=Clostridium perfringens TaxID=1502 RepID=UPI00295D51B4|nr:glycosyltransferase family 4 protein [Clostridium perfringens]MDM0876781.1 glycosyltransferase family 4 protein [Clostridium perfringens]MDM0893460.1 glycosyltransferase family 4 protein [Clostridium perfringens]HEE9817752.1 glycosyltransferase family 4 protein [Clostridium perfringens]HEO1700350.1 glycosyltransferase family 4 protein [Clostridium perfringens]